MKITYSTSKINSFGGINFADSIIGNAQVFNTIGQFLDNLFVRAQYRYSNLSRSYLLMSLCGGECAGDITEHLPGELSQVKNFDVCSADTLLATKKESIVSATNIRHDFNINISMNRLMVSLFVQIHHCAQSHPWHFKLIKTIRNIHPETTLRVMTVMCVVAEMRLIASLPTDDRILPDNLV